MEIKAKRVKFIIFLNWSDKTAFFKIFSENKKFKK